MIGTAANAADASQAGALLRETSSMLSAMRATAARTGAKKPEARAGMWRCSRASGEGWTSRASGTDAGAGRAVEGQRACEGRASVPCREELVPAQEGAIHGSGKERGASHQPVRADQPGHRKETIAGLAYPRCVLKATTASKEAPDVATRALAVLWSASKSPQRCRPFSACTMRLIDQCVPRSGRCPGDISSEPRSRFRSEPPHLMRLEGRRSTEAPKALERKRHVRF